MQITRGKQTKKPKDYDDKSFITIVSLFLHFIFKFYLGGSVPIESAVVRPSDAQQQRAFESSSSSKGGNATDSVSKNSTSS